MKKLLYAAAFLLTTGQLLAQACPGVVGGSSTCSVLPSPPQGRFVNYDSFPCVIRGQAYNETIRFNVPSVIVVPGVGTFNVTYMRFDTIGNLPCGLCWTSNKADNQFNAGEDGCIKISGTSNDNPGTYKLNIILHAKVSTMPQEQGPVSSELAGLKFYLSVINSGSNCTIPKDTATANLKQQSTLCPLGIDETTIAAKNLNVVPNPVTSEAHVTFVAEKSGQQQLHVYNMVGREVLFQEIAAKAGQNEVTFQKGNLPEGVYFISVGEGRNLATRRFIIAE
ncbi:MAG: T9SS type A sorting domain-containing protein [Chitinophagales bacterium]